jgi:peptide/nickel transport system substrate-binding protein
MLFCPTSPMKRLRRSPIAFAGFGIALGLLAAASCARHEAPAPPAAPLSLHLLGDPATLDPTAVTEEEELRVVWMMFRPLVGLDRQLAIVPALAKSWTVSPDGLSYEFHLDPAATWDDGSPVTSDDVRFTIERIRDPKVQAASWSGSFEEVAAIETPDAATVRVRFSRPYAERLLAFNLPIVSAKAFGRAKSRTETDRAPVGSGPYKFASWEPNRSIRLTRRPDAGKGGFAELVFRVIPSDSTRFQAGARGELDEFRIGRDQRAIAESSAEFMKRNRILRVPQPLQVLLLWNVRNPFLADPRVRRALSHAWSREDAAKLLYPPDGAALVSGPFPPGVSANAPDLAPAAFDKALAGRLLDEAGWKADPGGVRRKGGRKASLALLVKAGRRIDGNLAEILRSAYAQVGVELQIVALDAAQVAERAQVGDYDGYLTARFFLPPNFDPFPYYHSSQRAPQGQNTGFYANAEADRVMAQARLETDPEKRTALYRQVHRILAEDPPADFLWGADQYWGVSRRVEGVELSPIGLFHFLPGPLGWSPAPAAAR